MKIVFFGTTAFSVRVLATLVASGYCPVAIVTRPDKRQGRSLHIGRSAVKQYTLAHIPDVPLFQPQRASTEEFYVTLRALQPDIFLVVAYGEILKSPLLKIPSLGCMNVHTSLLPLYRGAAPIQRCLMDGVSQSGITFMEMVPQMDAGSIFWQEIIPISAQMNSAELEEQMASVCERVLPSILKNFPWYQANKKQQDESLVTFAPKITAEDCVLHWHWTGEKICNHIRALAPFPGAFTRIQIGTEIKRWKVLQARYVPEKIGPVGTYTMDGMSLKIACADGYIEPLVVQLEGKKTMFVQEFLRGHSKGFSFVHV